MSHAFTSTATVIPVYRETPDQIEIRRIAVSLGNTPTGHSFFAGPRSLDHSAYAARFPQVPILRFADQHFRDLSAYNRWIITPDLYVRLAEFEFVLVCQTDAILVKPLPTDTSWAFDYVGAPWHPPYVYGWSPRKRMLSRKGLTIRKRLLHVGNGGLSLRRTSTFATLPRLPRLGPLPPEDVFIAYHSRRLGVRLASSETADEFFMESGARDLPTDGPMPDVYGFHDLHSYNPLMEMRVLELFDA